MDKFYKLENSGLVRLVNTRNRALLETLTEKGYVFMNEKAEYWSDGEPVKSEETTAKTTKTKAKAEK